MEKEYIFKSKGKSFVKIKDDKISIIKKGIIYAVNQGFKGEKHFLSRIYLLFKSRKVVF